MMEKIPVTVLTGFLGSGKTTLLNRILAENHGQRIAVIENEFGEIGVDQDLVINADEEIFEMNNGCICCTVRGDLVRILGQLQEFRLELRDGQGWACVPRLSRLFDAGHSHDDEVRSFSIETDDPIDVQRFREWLGRELSISGTDIYRMKGFLNFKGSDQRIVIQGVHMLADTASLGLWGSRPRRTQLVFIGRNLDEQAMRSSFQTCLV
jgi:G3E family GTPase